MENKIYVVETKAARGNIVLASDEYNDYFEQNDSVEYVRKDVLIAEIKRQIEDLGMSGSVWAARAELRDTLSFIESL